MARRTKPNQYSPLLPLEYVKLKPDRLENGDGKALTLCEKCNGGGGGAHQWQIRTVHLLQRRWFGCEGR